MTAAIQERPALKGLPVQEFESLACQERAQLVRLARGMLNDAHEAEDMAQEALLRLCHHWETARNPRAWLYKTLSNLCIDRLRKRSRRLPPVQVQEPEEDPMVRKESHAAVRSALETLAPHERMAVLLREVEHLSYREIANTLDATVEQVTNWIYRGKTRLRRTLAPYMGREA